MLNTSFPLKEPSNHAVKLTAQGEKAVRTEHPWIFENSIEKIPEDIQAGDKAIIYDRKKNKFLGLGLIDPHSPIRIKMLAYKKSQTINKEWFQARIQQAYNIRLPLFETDTNSYRLIFGENDGMPGLIIDIYAEVAVMKIYSHIWYPYLHLFVELILEITGCDTLVLRLSRALQKNDQQSGLKDGQVLIGELPDETIIFREHGVLFSANVIHGHKTGYFLDHRNNRKKVGAFAQNKSVIDIFSYAGGFSVHALVGGASEVTSVDISKQALELAKFNAKLNGQFDNHTILAGDAFEIMNKLAKSGETYDIVVVDPPSFAKRASEVDIALKTYGRLTRLAIRLSGPKSMLVLASCSSRVSQEVFEDLIYDELQKSKKRFRIVEKTAHDIDHPITFPEGAYLKTVYVQMG